MTHTKTSCTCTQRGGPEARYPVLPQIGLDGKVYSPEWYEQMIWGLVAEMNSNKPQTTERKRKT